MAEHKERAQTDGLNAAEVLAIREFLTTLRWRAQTWQYLAGKFAAIRVWSVWLAAVVGAFTVGGTVIKSISHYFTR